MSSKQAQSSIEFAILVGFMIVMFTIFFVIIQQNYSSKLSQRQDRLVKEIGESVKSEIDLAFHSIDGYRREFSLPKSVYGTDYDIRVSEGAVFVKTVDNKHAISLSVLGVQGNIIKYDNVIRKENGVVILNG